MAGNVVAGISVVVQPIDKFLLFFPLGSFQWLLFCFFFLWLAMGNEGFASH